MEESFSLVTIEAMACGTPVIVLDTSAVKELVHKDNGIILHGHETENYLKAIMKINEAGMDRNQIAKSVVSYSADCFGKKVVEMYGQYLKER